MVHSFLELRFESSPIYLCYFCNKDCSKYMVVYEHEHFCSTECVSSYATFNEMLAYFEEKKRN
jgi:hypothetical protein